MYTETLNSMSDAIDQFIFDLLDSFNLAMASEGIDVITRSAVLLTVEDSIVNNIPEEFNA